MLKNKIDVIIPFKNREKKRIVTTLKWLNNELINKIFIVDYGSKKPIKINKENVEVIYYDKNPIWNKAHALNLGIKASKAEYIMTLDADMILSKKFFKCMENHLNNNSFIFSRKVRRIELKDISNSFEEMIEKSKKWKENYDWRSEVVNTTTGGVQIFPKKWINNIRGIDENLFYYGGMDNITLYHAKKEGLDVIDINEVILHQEHKKNKEANLPKNEKEFAEFVYKFRSNYMNQSIQSKNNPGFWGSKRKANQPMLEVYKKAYEKQKEEIKKSINLEIEPETKILFAIIHNGNGIPTYFMKNFLEMFMFTKMVFNNINVAYCQSCSVNEMRNLAVKTAIKGDYDYLIQFDVDHFYRQDFVLKLLSHKKNFVTGKTRQRVYPYNPTQYYKLKYPLKQENNFVYDNSGKLIKIEASGPVGMLMKVSELKKLKYPYYKINYKVKGGYLGGDLDFCRILKKKGYKIYLDTSIDFPHQTENFVLDNGKLVDRFKFFN